MKSSDFANANRGDLWTVLGLRTTPLSSIQRLLTSALGHDQTNPMLPSGVSCADTSGQGPFENHLFSKRSPTLFQSAQFNNLPPA